jgi:hypothetical protein
MRSDSSSGGCDLVATRTPLRFLAPSSSFVQYHNPLNLAWAGGIIDGEGCIHIKRSGVTPTSKNRTPHFSLELLVTMVEEETVREMQRLFDVGRVFAHTPHGCRTAFRWQCSTQAAVDVICNVLPFLRNKRHQAELGLQFIDIGTARGGKKLTDPALLAAREAIYWQMREAKK